LTVRRGIGPFLRARKAGDPSLFGGEAAIVLSMRPRRRVDPRRDVLPNSAWGPIYEMGKITIRWKDARRKPVSHSLCAMPAVPLQLSALDVTTGLLAVLRAGCRPLRSGMSNPGSVGTSFRSRRVLLQCGMKYSEIDAKLNQPYTSSDAASQQSAPGESLLVFSLTMLRSGCEPNESCSSDRSSRVQPAGD
jgi:hypothetical protein